VELFFSLDQTATCRIKAFYGTSGGTRLKTQAWGGLYRFYVLVAIVKKQLGLDLSLYKILQILKRHHFSKRNPNFRGVFQLQRRDPPMPNPASS